MIIALTALAFAMILGGLLSIFLGWDIVLIERGWTMVIAGSVSAACGALLLGITAAISKLAGIQAELSRLQGGLAAAALKAEALGGSRASANLAPMGLSSGLPGGAEDTAHEEKPGIPSSLDEENTSDVEIEKVGDRSAAKAYESVVPFPPRPSLESTPSRPEDEEPEIKVPEFLIADRRQDTEIELPVSNEGEDLHGIESTAEQREEKREADEIPGEPLEARAEPEVEAAPSEEEKAPASVEEAAVPESAASAEPRPATVIGTYNSGDNKYVMFSDGSIEAQTPNGIFHFKSLDELKEFIASGGEGGSAAAI